MGPSGPRRAVAAAGIRFMDESPIYKEVHCVL
jgi:hypothetical protein